MLWHWSTSNMDTRRGLVGKSIYKKSKGNCLRKEGEKKGKKSIGRCAQLACGQSGKVGSCGQQLLRVPCALFFLLTWPDGRCQLSIGCGLRWESLLDVQWLGGFPSRERQMCSGLFPFQRQNHEGWLCAGFWVSLVHYIAPFAWHFSGFVASAPQLCSSDPQRDIKQTRPDWTGPDQNKPQATLPALLL